MTSHWLTTVCSVVAFAWACGAQAQQTRVYIAPDDHTDLMWAADETEYAKAFDDTLDHYLDLANLTQDRPPGLRTVWNADGSLWVATFEKNRADRFPELIKRLRDGTVSMPLTTIVSTHGGTPAEGVIRDMYYAGRIERRYGLRFPLAVSMENATLPFGLGSLYAGAGAKYTWRGICGCGTRIPGDPTTGNVGPGQRENEMYWWVGADGSRLLTKWQSLHPGAVQPYAAYDGQFDGNGNQAIGGYAEARFPASVVDYVTNDAEFRASYPYKVIGAFGQGWDDIATIVPLDDPDRSFPLIAAQLTTPDRKVIVSNEKDFFADFEKTYGATLPKQSVTFGNEWDLAAASLAAVSSSVKQATEELRAGEAMATLVSLQTPSFMTGREAARDAAFTGYGLYFEHNFIGSGPACGRNGTCDPQRIAYERRHAAEITTYADTLTADSLTALGGLIRPLAADAADRRFVFNPLGWRRSDVADIAYPGTGAVSVVDATGAEIASETVGVGTARRLRFLAADLPAIGYRVFTIRPGVAPAARPATAVRNGGTLTTARYALTMTANGAITALTDRLRGNTALLQTIGGAASNDFGLTGGALVLENNGPVSVTLRATVPARSGKPPLTARVTLYNDLDRIDVRDDVTANFTDIQTIAFSFNLDAPDVWHEESGAVIRARLAPDGAYSPRVFNTNYNWQTLNHFADMTNGDGTHGVTLSNADAYFMTLGNSDVSNLDTTTPQFNVIAGGRLEDRGMPDQGGDSAFTWRFSLLPHGAQDLTASMRGAMEHQNPARVGTVTGSATSPYAADQFGLLTVSDPNVLLWALKPAEEGIGSGVIARVWNQSARPRAANLTLSAPYTVRSATRTTHIETDLGSIPVRQGAASVQVAQKQIATFRLRP